MKFFLAELWCGVTGYCVYAYVMKTPIWKKNYFFRLYVL